MNNYIFVIEYKREISKGDLLMNLLKYIIFLIGYVGAGFFLLLYAVIIQKLKGQEAAEELARPFTYSLSKNCFLWFGINPKISGLENLPKEGGYMIVANHQSSLDAAVIMGFVTQRGYYVIKKEIEKIPLFNLMGKVLGISIDRKSPQQAAGVLKRIILLLKSGEVIVLFPEGTRSPDGMMGEIKKGSLRISMLSKVPVVPVAISGTKDVNPRGSMYIHRKPVSAVILPAVDPSNFAKEEDFIAEIKKRIESRIVH